MSRIARGEPLIQKTRSVAAREGLTELLTSVDTGWAIENPRNPLTHGHEH
jgi:hypothetical protein